MTLTAAQARDTGSARLDRCRPVSQRPEAISRIQYEARTLLGWTSAALAKRARVGFDKVLKAQDDSGIAALNWLDLQAIRQAFERSGVEFTSDGTVRLRKGIP